MTTPVLVKTQPVRSAVGWHCHSLLAIGGSLSSRNSLETWDFKQPFAPGLSPTGTAHKLTQTRWDGKGCERDFACQIRTTIAECGPTSARLASQIRPK